MSTPSTTGTLTRITLAAPWRRVDLVLPSETPLGELLPEIVRLLDYHPGESPENYRVSLFDGRVIEFHQSLRSAEVADGTLVRVDRVDVAPMPAVIHDVTDEVADDLERRPGRWGDTARTWLATAVIAGAASWGTLLSVPEVPALALVAIGALLLASGPGVAFAGARSSGTAILFAGTAMAATAIPGWLPQWQLRVLAWAVLIGLTVLSAGTATAHFRAGMTGAATMLGLVALWTVPSALRLPWERTGTVLAVVSILLLGLLPRLALAGSGLTRLDDQQLGERTVSRSSVRAALDSAHRGLALAVVFTALSAASAGWVLATSGNAWALALACLLAVSTWLRARTCPLTLEIASLTIATLTIVVGLVSHWLRTTPALWWGGMLVAVAVLGLGFAALSYRPPAHTRARARQFADRLEGIAVIAMVPVAVGVFGIYERLLNTF